MSRDLRAGDGTGPLVPLRPVILIVDDDPGIRESFRLILEERYELVEAGDGRQAIEIVRTSEVDLVLLDIRLPDLDGFTVAEQLAARPRSPVVVLISSRDESTYADRLARTPARGFIGKRELSGAALAPLLR
jgi:CheY-like chemotaxis protein